MRLLSLGALWGILGGGPDADGPLAARPIETVVIDSRQAKPGSLFVALRGERQDGHSHVSDAFGRGANVALISRPLEGCRVLPIGEPLPAVPISAPVGILVPDVLQALQDLAAGWRRRHSACRVVAVTGSVGKTSTKEAIAAALAQRYAVLKSAGNFNNEIGLPLTLLQLHKGHDRAVLEMGMYAAGEIARLAELAAPSVGVVTNVGPVHLERLGSIDAIARAKAELPQALPADGVLVVNGDDARVRRMADETRARIVIRYGLGEGCDLRASDVRVCGLQGISARFHYEGETWPIHLPWLGRHNIYAALAATAVGLVEGMAREEIVAGLEGCLGLGRMRIVTGHAGATILDDSYNASPASALADLDLLADLEGRRLAVLGDMLELGSYEEEGHREVGRRAAEVLDALLAIGPRAHWIAEEARNQNPGLTVMHFDERGAAASWLRQELRPGDTVLVKASRGMALEELVATLSEEDA